MENAWKGLGGLGRAWMSLDEPGFVWRDLLWLDPLGSLWRIALGVKIQLRVNEPDKLIVRPTKWLTDCIRATALELDEASGRHNKPALALRFACFLGESKLGSKFRRLMDSTPSWLLACQQLAMHFPFAARVPYWAVPKAARLVQVRSSQGHTKQINIFHAFFSILYHSFCSHREPRDQMIMGALRAKAHKHVDRFIGRFIRSPSRSPAPPSSPSTG